MIRVKGRYRGQSVELETPIDLPEGTEVDVEIEPAAESDRESWGDLGMTRLEEAWDNPEDAAYDDWRTLHGV